jgi:hypothetical protein
MEQHSINLFWTNEFDALSGRSLYLSAQTRTSSRDGYGHPTKLEVTLYIESKELQHAVPTEGYGVASVSGKVPWHLRQSHPARIQDHNRAQLPENF